MTNARVAAVSLTLVWAACARREAREPGAGGGAMVQLGGGPVAVEVRADAASSDVARAPAAGRRVVLELAGVRFDRTPDTTYEVYVNLPQGTGPDPRSPYYAGNVASYAPPGHETTTQLDITDLVRELSSAGAWDPAHVSVTFAPARLELPPGVAAPAQASASPGVIRRVSITAG